MARGGARTGAGRKAGAVTRKTRAVADKAAAEGITPLDVMLEAMRKHYHADDIEGAAAFAKDAAPYVHAKLANIDAKVTGADGGPLLSNITVTFVKPTHA